MIAGLLHRDNPPQSISEKGFSTSSIDLKPKGQANPLDEKLTSYSNWVGASQVMRDLFKHVQKLAKSSATVLILGETGAGKEIIGRAVHELSPRCSGPFIRVNCGALSESLLESELFGHVKGAFTNAIENRVGRFEAAHGGTILLDEINSVSQNLQINLLRVLQEQQFERVGDTRTISVDCRIIAATNRDLAEMVDDGDFREDLYYRLNVLPIYVPPLRDRKEDIPDLARFFVRQYSAQNQKLVLNISADALAHLERYQWPGNVRELRNYIERAVVLAEQEELTADLLPAQVRGEAPIRMGRTDRSEMQALCAELVARGVSDLGETGNYHEQMIALVERELIAQILRTSRSQSRAALRLGINRNTLRKKIEDFRLESELD
ncbi:sigma-54 interaction domain-containing protein [Planctomicrobium piriforme]|uniref:Nif-specific regulatory protein n=1 Tax=Planctomicrobium piriforme TaxID=1576369 RepID=A0A1I3M4C9_9PLAN|nr:sigma-54 dependent transcriptional regulator [Planctomicrobium piriforme]SFI91566.1 Nif-specific regulatory protein [Planctomicrobium piriforme]